MDLEQAITNSTSHRRSRDILAERCLNQSEELEILLRIAFDTEHWAHVKGCWILELVLLEDLPRLFPQLERFIYCLPKLTQEGAIRSLSHIVLLLAQTHTKNKNTFRLTNSQIDALVEIAFDWLIGDHKVAAKAYAMRTLYCFSNEREWIRPELLEILNKEFACQSPAYRSAAKDIIKRLTP